nr:uncharacterized protein LOC117278246 [Nicotiana tomentosiformis]
MGKFKTGRGLNQELGLSRACDTRCDSYYKSFKIFIRMFGSILDVLEALVVHARLMDERAKAMGFLRTCQTFEFAFMLHLMRDVLAFTNELNKCLQKKEQDIANVMLLVEVAKRSFDIKKIMKMAKLYPDDFDEVSMDALENQLATYIIDVRDIDERFSNLNGLYDLSRKLVQTKRHLNLPLVFCLVKFDLLLPVATTSFERAFSAMKFIKNGMRNRTNDELLSGCLILTPLCVNSGFATALGYTGHET